MNTANKVLFVGEYAGMVGGIERYMYQTCALLKEIGCQVHGVFMADAEHKEKFVEVFDQVWRYEDLLRFKPDFDVVIVHKIRSAEMLKQLKNLYKHVVIFVHDHEYYCPARSYYFPFTRKNCHRAYRRFFCAGCASLRAHCSLGYNFFGANKLWNEVAVSDEFLVISDFMRDNLVLNGVDENKITKMIPWVEAENGTNDEYKMDDKVPHLLNFGQLIKGKGCDLLLDALAYVQEKFILDILGHGNEEYNLKAHPMAQNDNVKFHAWTNRPQDFIKNAYCVVLPWRWQEPFGLVGAEALAQGVPVVGFDVGGVKEYLIDNEDGILVESQDVEQLGLAIDRVLKDRNLRMELGSNGRKLIAEKFCKDNVCAKWKSWMQGILKE